MRKKKATMLDVAAAAGVSQSTVSMVLNRGSSTFPPETVEKVLKAAGELGYELRKSAAREAGGRTILVVSVHPANPYYCAICHGVDQAAILQEVSIVTCYTYHNPLLEQKYLEMALEQRFLGVIYLYPPDNAGSFQKASLQLPIVAICDRSNSVAGDIVELSNFDAGAMAARHLLDLGHTNIAVLTTGSDRATTSRATRVAGVLDEVKKVVSEDHVLVLSGERSWTSIMEETFPYYRLGYELAQNRRIFQRGITGIICLNDMLAYGAMDALMSLGYRIPRDFSILGADNIPYSSLLPISLTTVEHHLDVVAHSALTTLLNRTRIAGASYAGGVARFQVQCQPSLVVRGSTGPAARQDD